MSLRPRDVSQEDWYVKATERARLIEQAVQARNDAKWQELRGPSMEKLKPELDKMETENAKGARELLTFIYTPTKSRWTLMASTRRCSRRRRASSSTRGGS